MVAAMIQQRPSATAPAKIAAATLCSWPICFQRSMGASLTTSEKATTNTKMPSAAKMRALSTAMSVIRAKCTSGPAFTAETLRHGEKRGKTTSEEFSNSVELGRRGGSLGLVYREGFGLLRWRSAEEAEDAEKRGMLEIWAFVVPDRSA